MNACRTTPLHADRLQRQEWPLTLDTMASRGTGLSVFLNVRNWVLHSGGVYRLREAPSRGYHRDRDPSPSTLFEIMQNETVKYRQALTRPAYTIPMHVLRVELLGGRRIRAHTEAICDHIRDLNLKGKFDSTIMDDTTDYPVLQLHHGTQRYLHFDEVDDMWDQLTGAESPSSHRLWSWRCAIAKTVYQAMWDEPYAGCTQLQMVGEVLVVLHLRVQSYAEHAEYCHSRYKEHETRCRQFLDHMAGPAAEEERLQRKIDATEWASRGRFASREHAYASHASRQVSYWKNVSIRRIVGPDTLPMYHANTAWTKQHIRTTDYWRVASDVVTIVHLTLALKQRTSQRSCSLKCPGCTVRKDTTEYIT